MKTKKKYLPLYEKWLNQCHMDEQGLCGNFVYDDLLPIFTPVGEDEYPPLSHHKAKFCHWAFDGEQYITDVPSSLEFTPLRQTIVLFMAAMNGEL